MKAFPSPSGSLLVSPRELFSGRKVDYKRDASAEFGAYAQVFVPTAGKMEPRTEAGIVMLARRYPLLPSYLRYGIGS